MSVLTKGPHIRKKGFIVITVGFPGYKEVCYYVPCSQKDKLSTFLKKMDPSSQQTDSNEELVPWEKLAKDRIEKHKKVGLALRGARYRENMSQRELAKKSGINQTEISKIENGHRSVGEKVAKRLAKPLNIDYRILLGVSF